MEGMLTILPRMSGSIHLPIAIRDQELIKRAFAGEDVVGEFEREKRGIEAEDDDKEIDNTLPGWGVGSATGLASERRVGRKAGLSPRWKA